MLGRLPPRAIGRRELFARCAYHRRMAEIDTDRLIWIVVGIQLTAELGDRPLAYKVEAEVKRRLGEKLGAAPPNGPPRLAPVVVSDVFYLNSEEAQDRPAISIGGPGMNALAALLTDQLPTPVAIENTLVIQMDLELKDQRVSVWGMNHLDTVRAVDLFISKGYLDTFVDGVIARLEQEEDDDPGTHGGS